MGWLRRIRLVAMWLLGWEQVSLLLLVATVYAVLTTWSYSRDGQDRPALANGLTMTGVETGAAPQLEDDDVDFVDVVGPDGKIIWSTRAERPTTGGPARSCFDELRSNPAQNVCIGDPYFGPIQQPSAFDFFSSCFHARRIRPCIGFG